jgi:hypothetical protein
VRLACARSASGLHPVRGTGGGRLAYRVRQVCWPRSTACDALRPGQRRPRQETGAAQSRQADGLPVPAPGREDVQEHLVQQREQARRDRGRRKSNRPRSFQPAEFLSCSAGARRLRAGSHCGPWPSHAAADDTLRNRKRTSAPEFCPRSGRSLRSGDPIRARPDPAAVPKLISAGRQPRQARLRPPPQARFEAFAVAALNPPTYEFTTNLGCNKPEYPRLSWIRR